jgi:hypothetical protein
MLNLSSDYRYEQQRQTSFWNFMSLLGATWDFIGVFLGNTAFHNIGGLLTFSLFVRH